MAKINNFVILIVMGILSLNGVLAPQGHPFSQIAEPYTFDSVITANGGINLPDISTVNFGNGKVIISNGDNILDVTGKVKISGILDLNNNKITRVSEPSASTDAATKKYVDDKISTNGQWVKSGS